jgi:hypothetical protein
MGIFNKYTPTSLEDMEDESGTIEVGSNVVVPEGEATKVTTEVTVEPVPAEEPKVEEEKTEE